MSQKVDLKPLLRFMKTLPKSGDVELSLLKVHLLIEEMLTVIISKSFKNPSHLKEARLSFSQKIKLARAADGIPHEEWVWKALDLLNKARNELSHNLTAEEITEKLENFTSYVELHHKELPRENSSEKFTRFHWSVFVVYMLISTVANFDPASIRYKTLLGGSYA